MATTSGPVDVFCDMDTDAGTGWTVFYRRTDGSQDFTYSQNRYEISGIGSPHDSEFLIPLADLALIAT